MNSTELTKLIIAKMLKENTGSHFLDSGGSPKYDENGKYLGSKHGYGRHHESNQLRKFDEEPEYILRIDEYGIEYTRNLYHFLVNNLEYESELTNSLNSFEASQDDRYKSWFDITQDWIESKGYESVARDNIYNGENNLSQVFIYEVINLEPENIISDIYEWQYIILQIHGGADVRGGYTAPKIFSILEDSFWMVSDGYICCDNNRDHNWYSDDSYHWYDNGTCGLNAGKQLEEYDLLSLNEYLESDEYLQQIDKMIVVDSRQGSLIPGYNPKVINPVKYPEDTILYDEDSIGLCPLCAIEGDLNKLI